MVAMPRGTSPSVNGQVAATGGMRTKTGCTTWPYGIWHPCGSLLFLSGSAGVELGSWLHKQKVQAAQHAQGTPLSSGYGCGYMSLDLLLRSSVPARRGLIVAVLWPKFRCRKDYRFEEDVANLRVSFPAVCSGVSSAHSVSRLQTAFKKPGICAPGC